MSKGKIKSELQGAHRRCAYWMHDFLINHGAVWKNLRDIRKKLCVSGAYSAAVNAGETKELRALLNYAVKHTVYYSTLRDDAHLTDFPVMNKTKLNEQYANILVPEYRTQKTHTMYTSGSTGIPFKVVQDLDKRFRHIADLKYFGSLAGYRDHDPMCYLRAKPTATQKEQSEQNIWQMDISNLSEENLAAYYEAMVKKNCVALIAYPSTLTTAVTFWAKRFVNRSSIRTIISTSEALTSDMRSRLRDFFGESCRITARYSNTENGILGQENGEDGKYELNWASYYFEVLKLESDEPASDGELGRIIVTDIYNKAFPMIRYDTGDVAKLVKPKDDFPYLTDLFGRRMDLIYDTKHEVVSPFLLCRTMRLSEGIEQWQFIQNDEMTFTLRISVTHGEKPSCDKEIEALLRVLGADANIIVEYVEEIPIMNSLKRQLIVSQLK